MDKLIANEWMNTNSVVIQCSATYIVMINTYWLKESCSWKNLGGGHNVVRRTLYGAHCSNVSRLSPLFILKLFLEHSEIEYCYFLYQLVLIDMCIYIIYSTFFYFMLHRAPVDTSLVTEGVTLFKYQLLLLLLLLIFKSWPRATYFPSRCRKCLSFLIFKSQFSHPLPPLY